MAKKKKEIFDSKKFIEIVLIRDTGNILANGFDYFTFVAIAQGIEVLGSFFDKLPFDTYRRGSPERRFKKALVKLFEKKYSKRGKWFYKNLRCGLAHLLRPKSGIKLTSFQSKATDAMHLKKINKQTYLVADVLYADYKKACEKLISKLEDPKNREIPKKKKKATQLVIEHKEISD